MWKTQLNLAEIVRWQFGKKYDGSEVRHKKLEAGEKRQILQILDAFIERGQLKRKGQNKQAA